MVTDFMYDGIKLSDKGYAIVSFKGAVDDKIDTDSQLSYNHISMMRGKRQPYVTATYEDVVEIEIYIAKNLCIDGGEDVTSSAYTISVDDMVYLKRWLVRPTPHKLKVVGNSEYDGIYWNGSFTLEEYVFGDGRIGAYLKFEGDAPFGYKDEVTKNISLGANESYTFNCTSDEIGWIYPNLQITVLSAGNLQITNGADNRVMIIKNCSANEVITITDKLQISSSLATHKIADDFNYVHYRVLNSFNNVVNTLHTNLPISATLTYTPYAKAVIV